MMIAEEVGPTPTDLDVGLPARFWQGLTFDWRGAICALGSCGGNPLGEGNVAQSAFALHEIRSERVKKPVLHRSPEDRPCSVCFTQLLWGQSISAMTLVSAAVRKPPSTALALRTHNQAFFSLHFRKAMSSVISMSLKCFMQP